MQPITVERIIEEKRAMLFPNDEYTEDEVRMALMSMDENFEAAMLRLPMRSPMITQVLSVVFGVPGVDRYYLGDFVKGLLKAFTIGGYGIWWIADMLSAQKRCRAYNCKKFMEAIRNPVEGIKLGDSEDTMKTITNVAKTAAPIIKDVAGSFKGIGDTFNVN